MTLDC